jgi:hypothetical protein
LSRRSNLALELMFQRKNATPPKATRIRTARMRLRKLRTERTIGNDAGAVNRGIDSSSPYGAVVTLIRALRLSPGVSGATAHPELSTKRFRPALCTVASASSEAFRISAGDPL